MEFLYTLAVVLAFIGIAFVLINIKQIFTGKEFSGTCASNSPFLKGKLGECNVCGKKPEEECKGDDQQKAPASA
jgi:rRNA maturation endonuclease Nob1